MYFLIFFCLFSPHSAGFILGILQKGLGLARNANAVHARRIAKQGTHRSKHAQHIVYTTSTKLASGRVSERAIVWVIHESGLKVGWDDSLYIWKQAPFDDVFYLVVSCTDCFLYVRILSGWSKGQCREAIICRIKAESLLSPNPC